jgi:hypothetical protein
MAQPLLVTRPPLVDDAENHIPPTGVGQAPTPHKPLSNAKTTSKINSKLQRLL